MPQLTAAVILIGNELLSGRTQDTNLQFIAQRLVLKGIRLSLATVIPDDEAVIVDAVRQASAQFTYVFTTGGIGPTHDDITSAAIAKAFNTELICHPEAYDILLHHYGIENFNPARQKMAYVPNGASLLTNAITSAPGFKMGNVFTLAGVPKIMQSMFLSLEDGLASAPPIISQSLHVLIAESLVAKGLSDIQDQHPSIDIGSYPFYDATQGHGTTLVAKGTDVTEITMVIEAIQALVVGLGSVPLSARPSSEPPFLTP